jgi:hypothetical protein
VVGEKSIRAIYMCIVFAIKCVRVFVLVRFGVCVLLLLLDRRQKKGTHTHRVVAQVQRSAVLMFVVLGCVHCVWRGSNGRVCELSSSIT